MKEIWKHIDVYDDYLVSNFGRVKSLKRNLIMKTHTDKYGYEIVSLRNKSRLAKKFKVHRLVAIAFIKNDNNYEAVNHKDENKYNNNVNNLEWCDNKYNSNYGTAIERTRDKNSKKVFCVNNTNGYIKEFNSKAEAKRNGFSDVWNSIKYNVNCKGYKIYNL